MRFPGFSLRKWYLDCITEGGDTLIGYSAVLHWNVFNLHYSSLIQANANSPVHTRTSLVGNHFPQMAGDKITWSAPAFNLEGTWTAMDQPVEKVLYESQVGKVIWSCLQPRSKVDILIGKEQHLTGLGYVEILDLGIKPWLLPISELRWGRFLSATDSVIWIDWRGSHPLNIVIHNGRELQASLSDEQVVLGPAEVLELSDQKILRTGALISTVLSSIPGMDKVVPKAILHADETKWRSRGRLRLAEKQNDGWAIHEVVRFNQELQ